MFDLVEHFMESCVEQNKAGKSSKSGMTCENPSLDWKQPTSSLSKPYDAYGCASFPGATLTCGSERNAVTHHLPFFITNTAVYRVYSAGSSLPCSS